MKRVVAERLVGNQRIRLPEVAGNNLAAVEVVHTGQVVGTARVADIVRVVGTDRTGPAADRTDPEEDTGLDPDTELMEGKLPWRSGARCQETEN